MSKVVLYNRDGSPLLIRVEDEEPESYRRNLIGFHVAHEARGNHVPARFPAEPEPDEEDEGEVIILEIEEAEEDES